MELTTYSFPSGRNDVLKPTRDTEARVQELKEELQSQQRDASSNLENRNDNGK